MAFSNIRANRVLAQTVTSNFFQGSNADISNIVCDNEIVNNNLTVNGNETIAGNVNINGVVNILNTTDTNGCTGTVGALVVVGGATINKQLYVGGTGCFGNNVNINGNLGVTGTINNAYLRFNNSSSKNCSVNNSLNGTPGTINTAFGYDTLQNSSTFNSAFGVECMQLNTGDYNSGYGVDCLRNNTGDYNCGFGYESMFVKTTGDNNTAVGVSSLYNVTGNCNTAIGFQTGGNITTGTNNTCVGFNALASSPTVSNEITLGDGNIELLRTYGVINTYNTTDIAGCIGTTGALIVAGGAAINKGLFVGGTGCFGNNVNVTGDVGITGGNLNLTGNLGVTGNVGITGGNLNLTGNLGVTGTINGVYMQTSGANFQISTVSDFASGSSLAINTGVWTALSDRRDKTNIESLPIGLELLNQLQPRRFKWDMRHWYDNQIPDGSKKEDNWTHGFIAQEFDEVQQNNDAEYLNLVNKSDPDALKIAQTNLIPVMVKAIQDLSKQNDELKERIEVLENKINSLIE